MNLENLNLVELNAQDTLNIEGGNWFTDVVDAGVGAAIVATSYAVAISTNVTITALSVAAGLRDGIVNGATEARN